MDSEKTILDKNYDPAPIEDKWYGKWTEDELFKADTASCKPQFSIVIPPPNVTGKLHVGHSLDNTLQDILCRTKRMQGYEVLWVPGTDHAGIATQNVVERSLAAEGISRHDLGREEFVNRVWKWKEEYGSAIISQLKKLGASCDWSRERFTMDEGLSAAVRKMFVSLYNDGLIYRGKYLINWCPRCQTALSDLEVEHHDHDGKFYEVAYKFADEPGEVKVMTTRPETIMGDVAIAVHPRDQKNRHLIGKKVIVPIVHRVIPVIEDNMVDPEFGSGCVKITPAHDPNDFLVGQRHGLEQIQVIDGSGIMTKDAGEKYAGLDRFEAREVVVEDLKAEGVLLGIQDIKHSVGECYRCHTVIEPYLSEQWFVKTRPLADKGVEMVKAGKIRFIPEQWTNVYYQWMENIRDWCISRQLWWGHRIPAWYCQDCGEIMVAAEAPHKCTKCGSTNLKQDEDVLDTWFSSGLWPFSTMGWPEKTEQLKKFYPTSVLVTGFDIIFFWVARMIMFGLYGTKEVPFRDIYIHALVRDEKGQKMSKSKGNVIDPLVIVKDYGADALRLTMAALTVQGRDIFLSTERIATYRLFLNKLWNASRFALMNLEDAEKGQKWDEKQLKLQDKWILNRLAEVTAEITKLLDGYFFGEAARLMYDFVWGELCDWYLELAKPALRGDEGEERRKSTQAVLLVLFEDVLKLLHPFIPFVTEELWHAFPFGDSYVMKNSWPKARPETLDEKAAADMKFVQEIIRTIRSLRAEARIAPSQQIPRVEITVHDDDKLALVNENERQILLLTRVEAIVVSESKPEKSLASVLDDVQIYLPVGDLLDLEKEIQRLKADLAKLEKDIAKSSGKLANQNFIDRAPAEVIEKEKTELAENSAKKERMLENLKSLAE
ncbi:MAG: valine--tRNA ligase [Synergistaceae bacterium]|nr:valine--tRNA ligase [Candidatus Equadaptatus faecalis]